MTTKYLFASCSISNNITPTSFMQIRNTETKQREPFKIDNLEKYTYLLLDFQTNRMVVMAGKGLSKITAVIVDYMTTMTGGLADVMILPEKIKDFDKNIKRFSNVNHVEFKVVDNSYNYVPPLKEALKDSIVESYTINFKLKEKDGRFFDKLKILKDSSPEVQGIKAFGKNEYNLDDVIDYFATQFTRTIPIDINDNNVLNQDYIRNKLLSVLD